MPPLYRYAGNFIDGSNYDLALADIKVLGLIDPGIAAGMGLSLLLLLPSLATVFP
jgi:hypothetical protein